MDDVMMKDYPELPYGDEDDYEAETKFNDLDDEETRLLLKSRKESLKEKKYWENSFIRRRFEKDSFKTAKSKLLDEHFDYVSNFFKDIDLEQEITDRSFIKYLVKNGYLVFNAELSDGVLITKYEFRSEEEILSFTSITVEGLTAENVDTLRSAIRAIYDKYVIIENDKLLKRSGIIAGVGISIIMLVTGLSVGLTRKGSDLIHQSKEWSKLKPAKKTKDIIPWTELTDAAGRSLSFTGRYLTVILILSASYLIIKKKKHVR